MRHQSILRALLVISLGFFHSLAQRPPAKRNHDTHDYYVVEHRPSTGVPLDEVTRHLGVELVDRVGELDDIWLVRAPKDPFATSQELERRDDEVIVPRGGDKVLDSYRRLRASALDGGLSPRSEDSHLHPDQAAKLYTSISHLEKQELHELDHRAPPPIRRPPTIDSVINKFNVEDPLFPRQWHLVNERYPENMMNVTPVWDMGYTGKGILTALIDDGLDYTAADLAEKFDAENSYDFNDHVPLPYPKLEWQHHGTRCAGQIAASKNNVCGVGIAYDSRVSGLRILGGRITTVDQATALNYGFQNVHIYSCSWGPRDDGTKMQAPRYIVRKAFLNGVNKGRGGKGSIYVFASGNGGRSGDQCNFDGYTNSIYSVTVGSVDYKGLHPTYSETCTANMIVAYSSGSGEHIVTTDRGQNECAFSHGGTSAAAPNAAGVIALALQARPELTWRDVQHLCVETARRINPHDRDWDRTAAGRYYSNKYGFGVIDGSLYVQRALTWKLVDPQAWLQSPTIQIDGGRMDEELEFDGGRWIGPGGVNSTISITKEMLEEANLSAEKGLEHVTIKVWIDHTRRGDVEVELVSPNGVKSVLAQKRGRDEATTGYPGWTFMSVKHWGEKPIGDWTIRVSDQQTDADEGYFLGWNMILWGSTIDPSKAKLYEMDELDRVLPPGKSGTITPMRPVVPSSHNTTDTPAPHKGTPTKFKSPPHETAKAKPSPNPVLPATSQKEDGDGEEKSTFHKIKDTAIEHSWLSGLVFFLFVGSIIGSIAFCCWRRRRGAINDQYVPLSAVEESVPMGEMGAAAARGGGPQYRDEDANGQAREGQSQQPANMTSEQLEPRSIA
ncbi:kex protein [Coprinopsis cinerea AmutBmut pab1-1]|nr:kex protein [Coprinopsis cinerea AmutBmut pab1-1]